jgi:hypothetical protein
LTDLWPPQSGPFPAFSSFDAAISKKVAVAGSTTYGSFTNGVGLVTRGDIGIDW